jgi:hypothetical protein
VVEAAERLVELYDAWDRPEQVEFQHCCQTMALIK